MPQKTVMSMDLDEAGHHPEDFDQFVALLDFLSVPIVYPPDGLMQDNISFEIFVNICYHLPPRDLLMLACVCKNFNNMLNGNLFPICSEIWKSSRERFTVFKDMDPPRGMSQQQFVRLLNFERGCEFCNNKLHIQIYWPANVRACKSCILEKAKTHQELETEFKIDPKVLNVIPHLIPCPDDNGRSHYYWLPHALTVQSEFDKNSGIPKEYKKSDLQRLNHDSIRRYRWITQCLLEQVAEQKSVVKAIIQNMGLGDLSLSGDPIAEQILEDIDANPFIKPDLNACTEALKSLKSRKSSRSPRATIKREKGNDVNAKTSIHTPPKAPKKSSTQSRHVKSQSHSSLPTGNSAASNSSTSGVYIKTEEEPVDWSSGSYNNTLPSRVNELSPEHVGGRRSSTPLTTGKKNRSSFPPLDRGPNGAPATHTGDVNKDKSSFSAVDGFLRNGTSSTFLGDVIKSEPIEYDNRNRPSFSAVPVGGKRKGMTYPLTDEGKKVYSATRVTSSRHFNHVTPTVDSMARSDVQKTPMVLERPRANINVQQPLIYRSDIPVTFLPPRDLPIVDRNVPYDVLLRRDEIVKGIKLVVTTDNPLPHSKHKSSVPFTINVKDPLFQFLSLCKLFISPPTFSKNGGGYDRALLYDIVKKLQQEATLLKNTCKVYPPHILEIQGAISRNIYNYPIFRCHPCRNNGTIRPQVLRRIEKHVTDVHRSRKVDEFAYVDENSVINYLHFAFLPELHPPHAPRP